MAQAKVFHARLTADGHMYDPRMEGAWPLDDEHYTLVARVELPDGIGDAEAREYAFERTNSIEAHWSRNKDVRPGPAGASLRSTSVGDVVVLDSGAFRVEGAGWSAVTP